MSIALQQPWYARHRKRGGKAHWALPAAPRFAQRDARRGSSRSFSSVQGHCIARDPRKEGSTAHGGGTGSGLREDSRFGQFKGFTVRAA